MDTELTVAIAQIATGLATLIVAIFLAGQLLLQRRTLSLAHEDSVREQLYASEIRRDELGIAVATNESLARLWVEGSEDISQLDSVSHYRFRTYMRSWMMWLITDYKLRRDTANAQAFENLLRTFFTAKGRRDQYVGDFRASFFQVPELLDIADRVYEEYEGTPVSKAGDVAAKFASQVTRNKDIWSDGKID